MVKVYFSTSWSRTGDSIKGFFPLVGLCVFSPPVYPLVILALIERLFDHAPTPALAPAYPFVSGLAHQTNMSASRKAGPAMDSAGQWDGRKGRVILSSRVWFLSNVMICLFSVARVTIIAICFWVRLRKIFFSRFCFMENQEWCVY